ncbi:hypothetical protein KGQ71_04815, partial [Patescibacteria group bacterium]|nr:hypothetical protein [Patescibacteria group bacterium]
MLLVVTAAGVGSVTAPRTVLAISPLDSFTDIINNTLPAADNVQHDISFILPPDAEQVTPSDWILINLPNYSQITVPYQLVGSYGNPIMTVVGTTLEITNIALLPGTRFELLGTTAENPKSQSGFEVIASIATGSATGLIRNQSTTVAGPGNSFISVSATVDSPLASL